MDTDTNKIDKAINGLQFLPIPLIQLFLFCVILSIISSHSSFLVNFAAFFCTHIENY